METWRGIICPCQVTLSSSNYNLHNQNSFYYSQSARLKTSNLYPLPLNDSENGVNHNLEVDIQRHVIEIYQIVFHAADHLVDIFGIAIFYLTP